MNQLQPNSKGAMVGLVLVLLLQLVLALTGQRGFSLPVLAAFAFAATCLIVWSEYRAGPRG